MKKYILLILIVGGYMLPAIGQTSINDILKIIESNNLQIKANKQLLVAERWSNKSSNSLDNPNISYSKVWDSKNSSETDSEITVTQGFDFPTSYISRNKSIKYKNSAVEAFYKKQRQDILLEAKIVCLEIVKLNQERQYIKQRMEYAQKLLVSYNSKVNSGNATKLDFNKIKLDILNQKTAYTLVKSNLKKTISQLKELNGNIEIDTSELNQYAELHTIPQYELLKEEILADSYEIKEAEYQYLAAKKEIAVNKSGWLPGFEVGYKHSYAPGRKSNGFVVGVTIPLFKNRGQVSLAKANSISKLYTQDIVKNRLLVSVYQAYQEALAIQQQVLDYEDLIDIESNMRLLEKALKGGEISITDYFVEMNIVYQSIQNYIELNNLLQKQLAKLYKHKL